MSEQTRTTIYLKQEDRERLQRLSRYGLGTSAACRAGLALLEQKLKAEAGMNTSTIEKWDGVRFLDGSTGIVIQDGGSKSLVRYDAPRESGADYQQDWFANDQLTVITRRRERLVGDEPPEVNVY